MFWNHLARSFPYKITTKTSQFEKRIKNTNYCSCSYFSHQWDHIYMSCFHTEAPDLEKFIYLLTYCYLSIATLVAYNRIHGNVPFFSNTRNFVKQNTWNAILGVIIRYIILKAQKLKMSYLPLALSNVSARWLPSLPYGNQ